MENKNIFSIRNLSFAYGNKPVLRKLNFDILENKVTTLMGANGSGKSTLLQIMSKNLIQNEGTVTLSGYKVTDIQLKEFAKRVAIVHQYNTAPEDLTVEQLVSYGRTPYQKFNSSKEEKDLDDKKVEQAMKITGVIKFKDTPVQSLSGGQKQRVWIAMALAQGTKILLLDEPTTYLDVRYQIQILKLVKQLNEKYNITVIMVLHDINQALAYSDEIIALAPNGTLVTKGKPEDVIVPVVISKMYGISLEVVTVRDKPFVITV